MERLLEWFENQKREAPIKSSPCLFGCFAHAYHKALGQGLFRVVGGEIRGKSKYHLKFVEKVTIYTHELAKIVNFEYVFVYSMEI